MHTFKIFKSVKGFDYESMQAFTPDKQVMDFKEHSFGFGHKPREQACAAPNRHVAIKSK